MWVLFMQLRHCFTRIPMTLTSFNETKGQHMANDARQKQETQPDCSSQLHSCLRSCQPFEYRITYRRTIHLRRQHGFSKTVSPIQVLQGSVELLALCGAGGHGQRATRRCRFLSLSLSSSLRLDFTYYPYGTTSTV
jgi:hypothetical protein